MRRREFNPKKVNRHFYKRHTTKVNRYQFIKENAGPKDVVKMCYALEVSRSGYYSWLNRKMSLRKQFNLKLLFLIKEIHIESEETYGAERIHKKVLEKGYLCSLKLVEKLMRIAQISSKIKAKYKSCTTDSNHKNKISPNILNQDFKTDAPGKVWVSDISQIKVGNNWMYLCIILDLFNREVVGWSFADNMETSLLIKAFNSAVNKYKPLKDCIFHSDRGSQYASDEFRSKLEKHNMKQSMSRKGNCWDNAVAESFFKTIKVERVNHVRYQTKDEAITNLFHYIEVFYNRKRIHSFLDFTSPVDFRKQYYKRAA